MIINDKFYEDADENVKKSVSIQVYNSIAQELRNKFDQC